MTNEKELQILRDKKKELDERVEFDKLILEGLKEIVTRIEDIQALFDGFEQDLLLEGMLNQADFIIDVMKSADLSLYSYNKYIHAVTNCEASTKEGIEGAIRIIDYAHMKITIDEVMEYYPTLEETQNKALNDMMERNADHEEMLMVR
jgi:hypothetical protein